MMLLADRLFAPFSPEFRQAFHARLSDAVVLQIQPIAELYMARLAQTPPASAWRPQDAWSDLTHCTPPWPSCWVEWHEPLPPDRRRRRHGQVVARPILGVAVVTDDVIPAEWAHTHLTTTPAQQVQLIAYGSQFPHRVAGTATVFLGPQGQLCHRQDPPDGVYVKHAVAGEFLAYVTSDPAGEPLRQRLHPENFADLAVAYFDFLWASPVLMALSYLARRQILMLTERIPLADPRHSGEDPVPYAKVCSFHLPKGDPACN